MTGQLIEPHGGALVDLLADPEQSARMIRRSAAWPSWSLTPRQMCDLELLMCGGFSPLRGFMGRADYDSVVEGMRLASGVLWPIPILLDVPEDVARPLERGSPLALRDPQGSILAVLTVSEIWRPDRNAEALKVYGSSSPEHPGVKHLLERTHPWCIGGTIEGLTPPTHHDFSHLRLTPKALRSGFERDGWDRVVAFQTRNPMHRAHQELTLRASRDVKAKLLIHPVVGMTRPGDLDHFTRVRCYQAILPRYPEGTARLSLLPLAMRMAGPREAVWHAIIRKNYGCTHLIVGRDHAGPGNDSAGRPFYGPYDAQELLRRFEKEIGVEMVPFRNMMYLKDRDVYVPEDEIPEGASPLSLSGTELRRRLARGVSIPEWFTFPEVSRELQRRHPPRMQQGFTIFFTGLSGAGKSTIANVLLIKFLERGDRPVTLLDGDLVRQNLSSELGFSREHRDINIRRIGYVASEITKNGGIAICAPIAPYDRLRREVRSVIEREGGFLLVHVSTPLPVCEKRDHKGLYAKARAGLLKEFTGVSDPYEAPGDAELTLDMSDRSPEWGAGAILNHLRSEGYISDGHVDE